jgi:hypothetical protein
VVWSFVKPLLDVKTQQKIRIFSNAEKNHMQEQLLQFVAPDNLPVQYGGLDETCDFQNEQGPWVDDEWMQRFI